MSLTYRSAKLVRGSVEISLNASPYSFVEESWADGGTSLELVVLIKASTWADVERSVSALQRMMTQAAYYAQAGAGDPVYIYSKNCDALTYTAEIGATWKRKMVLGGSARVTKSMASPTDVSAWVTLSLSVKATWLRAASVPLIEATSGLAGYAGGGLTVGASISPYVRRLSFTSTTGFTERVFWLFADPTSTNVVHLARLSGQMRVYYTASTKRLSLVDESGDLLINASRTFTAGDVIDLAIVYSTTYAAIFVDGVKLGSYTGTVDWPATPVRYRPVEQSGGAVPQTILSLQVWPTALSDAEIAALYAWGRPDPELPFAITPTDGATPTPVENTSAIYKLYNTPGDAPARLRPIVAGYTANYDALAVQVRTSGVPRASTGGPVVKFECESGTLGAATASTADASASAGNVARFTPAATTWAVRTTIAVCADAIHMDPYQGRWRLMLQAKDNAAAIQINSIRWRYKVAGVAGDYSDEVSLPSVATRCLVDLGELTLPPTAWPEGAAASAGTEYSGSYLVIEIETMNSTGSGGGTLDLDALYLAPADLEATATATSWVVADQVLFLDFASDPPAPCVLHDTWSTMEWGGSVTWEGNALELPPTTDPDDGALLWLYAYRDTSYQALPKDTLWAWLQILPGWES